MTQAVKYLVGFTATGTGTTTLTIGAAIESMRLPGAVMADGDTAVYAVRGLSGTNFDGNFQIAEYSYQAAGGTLTFVRLVASSTGTAINWTAGTKEVELIDAPGTGDRINVQTGASYTLQADDFFKSMVSMTATGAKTVAAPLNSTTPIVLREVLPIDNAGSGTLTFSVTAPATLNGVSGGSVSTSNQFTSLAVWQSAVDVWHARGGSTLLDPGIPVEDVAATTYTHVLGDVGKLKNFTAAGAKTLTINTQANVATKSGDAIGVKNSAASGDITISGPGFTTFTVAPGGTAQVIRKPTADNWVSIYTASSSAAAGPSIGLVSALNFNLLAI